MELLSAHIPLLWHELGWPLSRLLFFVSLGLLLGNLIESLNWSHGVARLASPLVRAARLSDTAGASFSMAFFSGVAANTMLAEAHDQGRMSKKELIFANLFNSLPTYFLHLPTLFFIAAPLLKETAFVYVGLTMGAACLRTLCIIILGRLVLAGQRELCVTCRLGTVKLKGWPQILATTLGRFRQRIKKIILITVPIYILIFLLNQGGIFTLLEQSMARDLSLLTWLDPQSLGIVIFQLSADLAAGLAAAGALLDSGSLTPPQVVLALLAGNVLSSPMRALRHQLPFYSGIFPPRLALQLIACNQGFRMGSIVLVAVFYYSLG